MCEIKTGDEVLVCGSVEVNDIRIFLYTAKDGRHVCQKRENWEEGKINYVTTWNEIKPAPKYETRVLGPVAMMEALIDHGFTCDECGDWQDPSGSYVFDSSMFWICGKSTKDSGWEWKEWMLEKIEVKP